MASLTGANASEFEGGLATTQGVVASVNAGGGIDGHPVKLVSADDASSLTQNLTAVQSVVSKGAQVVLEDSLFGSESYPYLQSHGIPTFGYGVDSPIWANPKATNFFPSTGSLDPSYPAFTSEGSYFKSQGVTSVAAVGYNLPSTTGAVKAMATSAKHFGLKVGYQNASLTIGSINFSTLALAIKSSGANGVFGSLSVADSLALASALKDAGASVKLLWLAGGYGQSLLQNKQDLAAAQGATIVSIYAPVELHNAATEAFQSLLSKYAHYSGIPELGQYEAYVQAQAGITALQRANPDFSLPNIVKQMRSDTAFTAAGINPGPVNFSTFGTGDVNAAGNTCMYVVKLEGTTFTVPNGGKPLCGTIISQ